VTKCKVGPVISVFAWRHYHKPRKSDGFRCVCWD